MEESAVHSFHIPVMGLAFTIDTPLKVARYGISSVVSIIEDQLLEDMRRHYCKIYGEQYLPIADTNEDYRAERITAYLDLLHELVAQQFEALKIQDFETGPELTRYFTLLSGHSPLRRMYEAMLALPDGTGKDMMAQQLKKRMQAGAIDVNIMAKVDNDRYDKDGLRMAPEYSDALSALRGFANSKLNASVVLSAGYNPRLYGYLAQFPCFLPDDNGHLCKKVILKVSDYRSAQIQGKILAKKGIWVSEFRIESGLNCGGHAFATDGMLLGPILETFKEKRAALQQELFDICNNALQAQNSTVFINLPAQKIAAQGGVGTAEEHRFLLSHYGLDSIGWGSPFLLVPEVTCVDEQTVGELSKAGKDDFYLSHASPLGVPFNNFRRSSSEAQRKTRIEKGRPGSPCYKKYLSSNTEFTEVPICTASRKYQHLKTQQLQQQGLSSEALERALAQVNEKDCLCEGLTAPALMKNDLPLHHKLSAVTICPGPNLAYFSGTFSLRQMVDHIYGRLSLLNAVSRSHMFVNELTLYIDYYHRHLIAPGTVPNEKQKRGKELFLKNLTEGISYYRKLLPRLLQDLNIAEEQLCDAVGLAYG